MQKSFLFLGFEKGSFNADQAVSVIGAGDKKSAKEIARKHLTTKNMNAGWSYDTRAECTERGDKECCKHTVIDINHQRELASLVGMRAA